ncbi:hypothetical protein KL906_004768 [Ogataea polymorpha]|nr:hypothetical protein KL906_004768 [Ogataea polymorpha]KAG7913922.1 hypothetical protein KL927_004901 [Ogataea polymorpha]
MACSHTVDVRALARVWQSIWPAALSNIDVITATTGREVDNNLHRANLHEESLVASAHVADVAEVQRSVDGQASKALLARSVTTQQLTVSEPAVAQAKNPAPGLVYFSAVIPNSVRR